MSDHPRIRIVSLNCWGLKFVSKNLEQRIEAIAHDLANSDYDIIALQEIWVRAHFERVRQRVSHRLQHSKFFYGGALGAGLAFFTHYPIIESGIHPYSLNGQPIDVAGGDWMVGKGAAHLVILHPVLGRVKLFNTHLFAKGGQPHQLINAWEYARLARTAAEIGNFVIGLGDFNATPTDLPIAIIREHASLTDSWVVVNPQSTTEVVTDPAQALHVLGITADSPLNTWSASKPWTRGTLGKRLDYVFYRQPIRPGQQIPVLRAIQAKVVFTEHVPGQTYSYSDHFGLEATLEIIPPAADATPQASIDQGGLSDANATMVIQALIDYYRVVGNRSRSELIIVGVLLLVLVGVAVGTAWLPHAWINPIFIVFTAIVSWYATTMFYEGFLFGNWEQRALMNVIEDVEVHKKGREILQGSRIGE